MIDPADLNSDHSEAHVATELRLYGPLVSRSCYLVCEDTNVNGHPAYHEFGPGPYEAVQRFLAEQEGWLVDSDCEKLLVSFNPSGYPWTKIRGAGHIQVSVNLPFVP
jgi:cephalosporin hydroxylase